MTCKKRRYSRQGALYAIVKATSELYSGKLKSDMTSRKMNGKEQKIGVMANCRKITPTIAYNPWTEEELHFPNKKELAIHFGINPKTVTAWFKFGKPVIDLMQDERGIIDIAKATQAPLKGFEIYTQEEWEE